MAVIDNLRLSADAVQTAISNFEARKAGLENSYLKISNEVRELDGKWHGEASEKFKGQFDTLYQNIKQSETVMSNVVADLKKALEIYQQNEAAAQSLVQSLEEGTQYTGGAL